MTNLTTTTTEKDYLFTMVKDARGLVEIGDKIRCRLTRTHGTMGVFANALVDKNGETYSVSGLFKGYFGEPETQVWGEVTSFDSKGKIAFKVCEDPQVTWEKEEALKMKIEAEMREELAQKQAILKEEISLSFEEELNNAKEQMRLDYEAKLKEALNEAEARIKEDLLQQEINNMVQDIAKITGNVSPKATELLSDLLTKHSVSDIGKTFAVVAASHDSSYDFVQKMEKIIRGCL